MKHSLLTPLKGFGAIALILFPGGRMIAQGAAQQAVDTPVYSPYTDPVFYGLCALVVVLLIFILQLQKVFGAVARNHVRKEKENSNLFKSIILILAAVGSAAPSYSQKAAAEAAQSSPTFLHEGFGSNAFNALFFLIIVEIAVVLYYARLIQIILHKQKAEDASYVNSPHYKPAPSFWDRFNKSVVVAEEAAIMTDHDYDGIRELDNALPPWWKYGFYLTILWAGAYLVYYEVSHTGPSSLQEYEQQLTQAEQEHAAYLAKSANSVDETNVKLLTEANDLSMGKETYDKLCNTCHGAFGEGKVGPNLTDAYWKHGGDIKDLFKTIKLGVSGTGMKPWKTDLSPAKIAQVASYILTLQGTHPAGAKAPEGELYTPVGTPTDTTAIVSDTTSVIKVDTTLTTKQ